MARPEEPPEQTGGERNPNPLRRLWPELRPFRKGLMLCAVLVTLQSGFAFAPPLVLGDIVNQLQQGRPINTGLYMVTIVGLAIGQAGLQYALSITMNRTAQTFLLHTRDRLLAHMQSLPLAYFEKNQVGKLVSNVMNDANTVQQLIVGHMTTMIGDIVMLVLVVGVLFRINWVMALMALSISPLYIANFRRFFRPLQETSKEIRGRRDSMFGQMQEKLAGIQTVKSFGQERWEARSFMANTRELMGLNVRQGVLGGGLWTTADALCGVATGGVLYYGGMLALRGEMQAGTLVMFLLYAVTYVYGPIVRFLVMLDPLARAQAALERIFRTLDTPNPIHERADAKPILGIRGEVRFEDVWFEYEAGQPVLKGIDLTVQPGEMVALVGFSGSGKTTMASLLLRHYDPTSGRITVDGMDLREANLRQYRSHVGVVAQESILFNTSLRENIRYGRADATDADIEAAARAANIHETIMDLPDGYNTRLGEDGIKLSVGEKQRIAIARALLADPHILIMDEATSSLDSQTEALLQSALDNLLRGRTSFVIAHRLSTIVKADKIVVLERGVVTELGTHQQLLERNGLYARLYQEQFRVALRAAS
jgi:subfamily B ATP-binding cassette protein MsbA